LIPMDHLRHAPPPELTTPQITPPVRALGALLRFAFIACVLVITVRVSLPQNETIWTAYDTPGDLVRMILGGFVCIWLVLQLFRAPKDAAAYRTWLYFGSAAVPFALLCLYAIW